MDKKLLAPCGTFYGSCSYFRKKSKPWCPGCGGHTGHPFWGVCKLYKCSTEHEVER